MKRLSMKKGLALAVVPVLAIAAVLFLQTRIGYALIKSRSHFVALGSDGRILYEPGAEARAERISLALDEAIGAVERGHFLPDDRGTYFKIKRSTDYGIKNPQLFYKESKLFVSYIMRRDPRAFGEFLVAIQRGEPFGPAFSRVLKVDVTEMWEEFTAALHSSS